MFENFETVEKNNQIQSALEIAESKGLRKFPIYLMNPTISRVKRGFCDCKGQKLIPLYREFHYFESRL
jgi:hypothetical protein